MAKIKTIGILTSGGDAFIHFSTYIVGTKGVYPLLCLGYRFK